MALSPHMSFAGVMNIGGPRHDTSQWPAEAGMTQHAGGGSANTMAQLIVDGTFERFPELRFYFAEINAAIFPAALYYMDRDYLEYNSWFELELPKMPSQYMKDHAHLRHGARAAGGEDRPGAARTTCRSSCSGGGATSRTRWARSRTRASTSRRRSPTCRPSCATRCCSGNAAEHLHLDLDADITETPAA